MAAEELQQDERPAKGRSTPREQDRSREASQTDLPTTEADHSLRRAAEVRPDYDGATAAVQLFPTEGPLFGKLNLSKPELQRLIGGLGGKARSYKMISVSPDEAGLLQQEGQG